jgi:hypothetical protein
MALFQLNDSPYRLRIKRQHRQCQEEESEGLIKAFAFLFHFIKNNIHHPFIAATSKGMLS